MELYGIKYKLGDLETSPFKKCPPGGALIGRVLIYFFFKNVSYFFMEIGT